MMNGRQRCGDGIVSHESGRTIRKKSAKVAVGKSTVAKRTAVRVRGASPAHEPRNGPSARPHGLRGGVRPPAYQSL